MPLHQEQVYVTDIARAKGIPLSVERHAYATSTCKEKAELLGWAQERVVKALYFRYGDHIVSIVVPDGGPIRPKDILPEVLGVSRRVAKRYCLADPLPSGMERGTCTPFVYVSSIGSEVSNIIIADVPGLEQTLVDVSLGGTGEQAHLHSLHLPYGGISTILEEQFPNRVQRYVTPTLARY
jgi:hypothetical protein